MKIPATGRNNPCPCGSGKKYKKCCLGKDESIASGQQNQRSLDEFHGLSPEQMYRLLYFPNWSASPRHSIQHPRPSY